MYININCTDISPKIKNNQGNAESKLNPTTECKCPPDKYTY